MKKIITILIGLLLTVSVYAADPVGNLIIKKGKIKLRRNNIDQILEQLNRPIDVFNQDEIQTGNQTKVIINFTIKSDQVELSSQSFFKIENITAEETNTSISIGKIKVKVNKKYKRRKKGKRRFSIRTTNALVGVKGTEFIMSTGVDVTSVLTIEGIVSMANIATPDIEVNVTENQVSQVKRAQTPTLPVTVPPEVQNEIIAVDSPAAFNDVQFGAVIEKVETTSNQKNDEKEQKDSESQKSDANSDPKALEDKESDAPPFVGGPPPTPPILEPLPEPEPPEPPIDIEVPEPPDYEPELEKNIEIKITY